MREAVIVAAVRSPGGRYRRGGLAATGAEEYGLQVVKGLLAKVPQLDPEDVHDLIVGCAFPEPETGMNLGRVLTLGAGLPIEASDELIQYYPTFQVNPSIKPQTGYHYEAGIRHAFTDEIEGNRTLSWMDLEDEIFFNPETFTNVNFPKTRRTGFEIGTTARPFSWLGLWGNYGYTKPLLRENPFSDNDIPGVPRHQGSLGVEIQCPKGFLLSGRVNAVGSSYLISDWRNQFEKLDGYYTVDAKLSYTWRGLEAFFGVNNLTNQEYEEWAVTNASGTSQVFYPSPERNLECPSCFVPHGPRFSGENNA